MLNISADFINERENREAAERKAVMEKTERLRMIGVLQQIIAEAERRMRAPVFVNDTAEGTYQIMKSSIERLANEYETRLWHELQGGRKYPLEPDSAGAICYFFGELMLAKLPGLADRITSRDGRGQGFAEERKSAVR